MDATKAFLRPALSRPNLTVMTHALVERMRIGRRGRLPRAEGIEFRIRAMADVSRRRRAETILAAGSIGSPSCCSSRASVLPHLLAARGIEPVHDLAGVGENLHDHLQIRMQYKVKEHVDAERAREQPDRKAAMALEYALFKTGPLTMPPSQLGAFGKKRPSQPTANIEWHVQPLSLDKFGEPLHTFPAITPSVCNLRPAVAGGSASHRPTRRISGDQAQLSVRAGRSPHGGGRHAVHTPHHGGEGARAIRAG